MASCLGEKGLVIDTLKNPSNALCHQYCMVSQTHNKKSLWFFTTLPPGLLLLCLGNISFGGR